MVKCEYCNRTAHFYWGKPLCYIHYMYERPENFIYVISELQRYKPHRISEWLKVLAVVRKYLPENIIEKYLSNCKRYHPPKPTPIFTRKKRNEIMDKVLK